MSKILAVCLLAASVSACSTPQGKKLASNATLPAIAAGPSTTASTLTWANKGEMVGVRKNGTVTVLLDSVKASGNTWHLSQIPDPSVVKVASHEYIASESASRRGTEKWVFKGVGPGDVEIGLWYGNIAPSPITEIPTFKFIASVDENGR